MGSMGSEFSDQQSWSSNGPSLPEIEARVCDKRALVNIHSDKRKGLLVRVLAEMEKLKLAVLNMNVVPFGSFAIDITIIAEMGDEIDLGATDIVRSLRPALREIV